MRELKPVLDKKNRFMFFGNHKVGLTSVVRNALKNRVIYWKKDRDVYYRKFDKYSLDEIKNMFKFTIVRNPFDRVVSAYFYLMNHGILVPSNNKLNFKILRRYKVYEDCPNKFIIYRESFKEFIKGDFKKEGVKVNYHFHPMFMRAQYSDFVARLENIKEDWKTIASRINCQKQLPKKNVTNHKEYTEFYDKECVEIVAKIYKKDLEYLKYKFEGVIRLDKK